MGWLFNRQLSAHEKTHFVAMIRHLQKMLAFQQITAEAYNRAARLAVDDEAGIQEHVLPALQFKRAVIRQMELEHSNFNFPTNKLLTEAHAAFTHLMGIMAARKIKQEESAYELINGRIELIAGQICDTTKSGVESLASETSHWAALELQAASEAVKRLNRLMEKAGLSPEEWIALNCEAFNAVRAEFKMPPFTIAEFAITFRTCLSGGEANFFVFPDPARP